MWNKIIKKSIRNYWYMQSKYWNLKKKIKLLYRLYEALNDTIAFNKVKDVLHEYEFSKEIRLDYKKAYNSFFNKKDVIMTGPVEVIRLPKLCDTINPESLEFHNEMKKKFKERLNTPAYRKEL